MLERDDTDTIGILRRPTILLREQENDERADRMAEKVLQGKAREIAEADSGGELPEFKIWITKTP